MVCSIALGVNLDLANHEIGGIGYGVLHEAVHEPVTCHQDSGAQAYCC